MTIMTRMNASPNSKKRTISRTDLLSDGSDDWLREIIYRLAQISGRLASFRDAFGREIDLTPSQFLVLMGVAYKQGDNGVAIAPLAQHIGLAATHVTTEVGRLVRRGIMDKRPSEEDRRSVLVSLTQEGEALVNRVSPLVRTVNDILFQDITKEELQVVLGFAEKLILNSEYALSEIRVYEFRRNRQPSLPKPETA